jgi:hypothetical protein
MILDLHRQGLSVSAIARQLRVDRKTVRIYIAEAWSRRSKKSGHQGGESSITSKPICANDWRPIPRSRPCGCGVSSRKRSFAGGYGIVPCTGAAAAGVLRNMRRHVHRT